MKLFVFLAALLAATPAYAECDGEDYQAFLEGNYVILGHTPEGPQDMYAGTANVTAKNCVLTIKRCVKDGATMEGKLVKTPQLGGDGLVTWMFKSPDGVQNYVYEIESDNDNYPVFHGVVIHKGGEKMGREFWHFAHDEKPICETE